MKKIVTLLVLVSLFNSADTFCQADSPGGNSILVESHSGYNEYRSEIADSAEKDFGVMELVPSSKTRATAKILQGRVIDEKKAPLSFANIALKNTDSKSIFQAYTDSLGQFKMSYSVAGKYTLEVSYSGYTAFKSAPFELQNRDFGVIALAPSIQNLKEVEIQAKKRPDNH